MVGIILFGVLGSPVIKASEGGIILYMAILFAGGVFGYLSGWASSTKITGPTLQELQSPAMREAMGLRQSAMPTITFLGVVAGITGVLGAFLFMLGIVPQATVLGGICLGSLLFIPVLYG